MYFSQSNNIFVPIFASSSPPELNFYGLVLYTFTLKLYRYRYRVRVTKVRDIKWLVVCECNYM